MKTGKMFFSRDNFLKKRERKINIFLPVFTDGKKWKNYPEKKVFTKKKKEIRKCILEKSCTCF